ncbi:MAG: glycoside hydrolase family 5 protein, partial [Chloroflexia bacterium]|nr:glycoside hydrolase family 5 protein [Chloroflexia bacterium]
MELSLPRPLPQPSLRLRHALLPRPLPRPLPQPTPRLRPVLLPIPVLLP